MRRALTPVFLLLTTPTLAVPSAPHGPGCALSTAECAVVAREIAIDDVQAADDEQEFGGGSDLRVRAALIARHAARTRARIARLPPSIGREFARLRACQSADRLASLQGAENTAPQCR